MYGTIQGAKANRSGGRVDADAVSSAASTRFGAKSSCTTFIRQCEEKAKKKKEKAADAEARHERLSGGRSPPDP